MVLDTTRKRVNQKILQKVFNKTKEHDAQKQFLLHI